jgi:ketosteroid isomerase-like protein
MITLDGMTVQMLQRHWEAGWNQRDVDTIMAPFAVDVVFSSPGIARMTGDASKTTIDGYDALRAYIETALRRTPELRYTLHATYVGTDSIVLVYACTLPDGTEKRGSDLMRVDGDGKVVEWRCHY